MPGADMLSMMYSMQMPFLPGFMPSKFFLKKDSFYRIMRPPEVYFGAGNYEENPHTQLEPGVTGTLTQKVFVLGRALWSMSYLAIPNR